MLKIWKSIKNIKITTNCLKKWHKWNVEQFKKVSKFPGYEKLKKVFTHKKKTEFIKNTKSVKGYQKLKVLLFKISTKSLKKYQQFI